MRRRWMLVAVVTVLVVGPAPVQADDPAAEAVLNDFNKAARAAYAAGRAQMHVRTDPVVLVACDTLFLRRKGKETKVSFTPDACHRLKSTAHVALGLFGALAPVADGDASWKTAVTDMRTRALAVRGVLDRPDFTPVQVERQRRLSDLSVAYIGTTLAAGRVDRGALGAYGRSIAPLVLANAKDAAKLQLDGLHAAFEPWRRQLSPEEWAHFAFALGAEAIVAQRLDRELLADGAQAHLLRMFGWLGRD